VKPAATATVSESSGAMKFHPVIFALIAYGITAIIAVCVTFIVKAIVFFTRDKPPAKQDKTKTESQDGIS